MKRLSYAFRGKAILFFRNMKLIIRNRHIKLKIEPSNELDNYIRWCSCTTCKHGRYDNYEECYTCDSGRHSLLSRSFKRIKSRIKGIGVKKSFCVYWRFPYEYQKG